MPMTSIYLIRHATPDWSRKDIPYHLPPGPPLTGVGRAEAEALGAFLHAAGVRRLFASPLERSLHTAQIAAALAQAQVQVDERLMEIQPGETADSLRQRLWPVFEMVSADGAAPDSPVGLVTHGGPIAALLGSLGMDAATLATYTRFDHGNPLPPAAAWLVARPNDQAPWQWNLAFTPEFQLSQ
jgi:broad specificity phosphatase PhoE